jgi:kynurenine formamidase
LGPANLGWDKPKDYDTELRCNGSGHILLIIRAGIYILENLNLEALVSSGQKESIFFASPLQIKGGTGSQVRPLALIPNS